jgi:predicted  nucleic acid-binding Zn-ribbon protein
MPDDNIVVFGAEFQSEGVNKGVEEIVGNLEKAKEAEAALKEEIEGLNEQLADNEKEIAQVTEAMGLMTKVSGKNKDGIAALNKQLDELRKKNEALKGHLNSSGKELDNVNKKVENFRQTTEKTKKSTNEIGKAINKFTDINKLGAKAVEDYGKQLFKLGKAAVEGFAIGIALEALPALLDFIQGLSEGTDGLKEFEKQAKITSAIQNKAAEAFAPDFAKLELFRKKLNDQNITAAERVKIAKEYNKTADEGNKIDTTQINNLDLINAQIAKQLQLLKERATARAAENVLAEKAEVLFKKEIEFRDNFPQITDAQVKSLRELDAAEKKRAENAENRAQDLINPRKDAGAKLDPFRVIRAQIAELDKVREEFQRTLTVAAQLTTTQGLITPDTKKIENVFAQKLLELRARLAQVSASVFLSDTLIKKDFAARLQKDFADIAQLVKAGSLTSQQGKILDSILKQINNVELGKALDDFKQKRIDAIQKINDTITQLQFDAATKRIAALHGEFERERATIQLDTDKTIATLQKQMGELFKGIDDQVKQGVITLETANDKKSILSAIFGDLIDQAKQEQLRRATELAFKQFNNFIQALRDQFENVGIGLSESFTKEVQEASEQFLKGQISYERYQRKLTEITQRETANRKRLQLQALNEELNLINKRLNEASTEAEQKQLQTQQRQLRTQIDALNREIATGDAETEGAKQKERLQRLTSYVEAIGNLAQSIGSFWQQVNKAEAQALDRSIALQQKRVDFAQQIAEHGNTEFLELEQKRLDELERKREANANRQLAIDNALALSQATVAAVTAIAQAVATGSPFAALAAVAAVIGAIAAAYQFVNSLQPPVAQFAEGTESVQGPGGKDKVPAYLTKGERVTRVKENKDYWDTLHAIHNRHIPPGVLNSFVNGYPATTVPLTDFDRLYAATNMSMGADSEEVLNKLGQLDGTMQEIVQAVSALGINVNLDADGFAASLTTYQRKKKRQKKA